MIIQEGCSRSAATSALSAGSGPQTICAVVRKAAVVAGRRSPLYRREISGKASAVSSYYGNLDRMDQRREERGVTPEDAVECGIGGFGRNRPPDVGVEHRLAQHEPSVHILRVRAR